MMVAWVVDLAIIAMEAVLPKSITMIAFAIFAMKAIMLKSGASSNMDGGIGNFCDGSSYA